MRSAPFVDGRDDLKLDALMNEPALKSHSGLADLLVRSGRLLDTVAGIDGPGGVLIVGDRIVAVGPAVDGPARVVLDEPDGLLLPGLIDLHAHPGVGLSRYGVDPDVHFLPRGVTTLLSQGDAGANTWAAFRDRVVRPAKMRIRVALNLSRQGESGRRPSFADLNDADIGAVVRTIAAAGDDIWGLAVNVRVVNTGRTDPREILRRGVAAAEATGKPILFGSRHSDDWPLAEQLAILRPGDVFTYCFNGEVDRIVVDGRVRPEVREARERGVLFDVGHGMSSFDFAVAEAAIADGFPPDTISTDQYARHVGSSPPHDLPRTLSKLLACGVPLVDACAAVTTRPAQVLGLAGEVGVLAPGTCADVTVLRLNADAARLRDTAGAERPGACWEPVLTIRAGVQVT